MSMTKGWEMSVKRGRERDRERKREREKERRGEERREWARECWSPKVTVRWAGIVLVCARHLAYSETA